MSTAQERTVDEHLSAYCEPDGARRMDAVRRLWHPTGRLVDPPLEGAGHEGIAEQGGHLLHQFPEHRFVRTTAIDAHHEFLRYGWQLRDPGGRTVLEGLDLMELDGEGRIRKVVGFFGLQPPAAATA